MNICPFILNIPRCMSSSTFYRKEYDASASVGTDSVFVDYNPMLYNYYYGIGHIDDEDSLYTMILPDNEAWDKAYAHISLILRRIMRTRLC